MMALCRNNKTDNYLITAVFIYAVSSMAWAVHSFFQVQFAWAPCVNLLFAFLACAILGLKLVCGLANDSINTYGGLKKKEKKQVQKIGKRLGKALFSLMKEKENWLGRFCRKLEDAK
jgi:hypothetical protein